MVALLVARVELRAHLARAEARAKEQALHAQVSAIVRVTELDTAVTTCHHLTARK